MSQFINPYQFVPASAPRPDDLDANDFLAGVAGHVTHDRFTPGTYSGRVVCRLTTRDAVVVGGRQVKHDKDDPPGPTDVYPYELDGEPAVPATTLRGLIASLAEAASNSALRVLVNAAYSVRAAMSEFLPAVGMIVVTPSGERRLRPLALGPLHIDAGGRTEQLGDGYRKMFTRPLLKVYLDGYSHDRAAQRLRASGFLARPPEALPSYSADRKEYWYLKLAGTASLSGDGRIEVTRPRLDSKSRTWVLGQEPAPRAVPISQDEYDKLPKAEQDQHTRGLLRIVGIEDGRAEHFPPGRKHELFLPYPPDMESYATFAITDKAWATFHDLAKSRTKADPTLPFHLRGSRRNAGGDPNDRHVCLRDGDLVYFRPDLSNPERVAELALSSIWRRDAARAAEYWKKVSPELLPFRRGERKTLSIAEQLFGFVEQRDGEPSRDEAAPALASRVRFSAALLAAGQADVYDQAKGVLKILSSPKPPSPAMYFRPKNAREGGYIPKGGLNPSNHVPNGRKFYVHRPEVGKGRPPWFTRDAAAAADQKMRVRPLRKGVVFHFHIDFENLSRRELALLAYALKPTDAFLHKLGLGKPLGLGAVEIEPLGIFYIDHRKRYLEQPLAVGTPRYHGCRRADLQAEKLEEVNKLYPREFATGAGDKSSPNYPACDELRQEYRAGMDEAVRRAIAVIGEPVHANRAVHTPQVEGEDLEEKTYQWFVANDDPRNGNRQWLKPITGNHLPKLDR